MLKRRTVLMGGTAMAAVAAVLPHTLLSAVAEEVASVEQDWWPMWKANFDAIPLHELPRHYEGMIRHCDATHMAQIMRPGPLSQDKFFRTHQYAYRRMMAGNYGVLYGEKLEDIMHHPV